MSVFWKTDRFGYDGDFMHGDPVPVEPVPVDPPIEEPTP